MVRIWIDEEGVVRIRARGLLDPVAMMQAHEHFYAEHWDAFVQADLHLADYRGVELGNIDAESIRTLAARNVEISQLRGPLRIAVLIDPGVGYGFARMWQQYAAETGWPLEVFTEEDKAWTWLRAGGGPA